MAGSSRIKTWLFLTLGVVCFALAVTSFRMYNRAWDELGGTVAFVLEPDLDVELAKDLRDTRAALVARLEQAGHRFAYAFNQNTARALTIFNQPPLEFGEALKLLDLPARFRLEARGDFLEIRHTPEHLASVQAKAMAGLPELLRRRCLHAGLERIQVRPRDGKAAQLAMDVPGAYLEGRNNPKVFGLLERGGFEVRLVARGPHTEFTSREGAHLEFGGQLPPGTELLPIPSQESWNDPFVFRPQGNARTLGGEVTPARWLLVETAVAYDGRSVLAVEARLSARRGGAELDITLDREGQEANARLTERAAAEGRSIAFLLDHKVCTTVRALTRISGDRIHLDMPGISLGAAGGLAAGLQGGALPAGLVIREQRFTPAGRAAILACPAFIFLGLFFGMAGAAFTTFGFAPGLWPSRG